jgi:hypothetical protein
MRADISLAALGAAAREQKLSEVVWLHDYCCAQRAFSRGDLTNSERWFGELAERGSRMNLAHAPMLHSVAQVLLTYDRGGVHAMASTPNIDALLTGLLALPPGYAVTGARLAAELGKVDLARQALHTFAERDFAALTPDLGYVNALANLSVVSLLLADRAHAARVYERLSPYAHHNTPSGAVGFYEGSASRFLGRLAAFLGQPGPAARHFDDALAQNEQLGAKAQVARTCVEYARFLQGAGQAKAVKDLQLRALTIARQVGLGGVEHDALALSRA